MYSTNKYIIFMKAIIRDTKKVEKNPNQYVINNSWQCSLYKIIIKLNQIRVKYLKLTKIMLY